MDVDDASSSARANRSAPTGRRSRGRATIDDVADAAGVSVATVSRALRGLPNVADSTRQRVEEAAAGLRYSPDPAAARLAAGRTGTVTVAIPALDGWYFSTVVAGAESVCRDAGFEFQAIGIRTLDDRDRLLDDDHHLERRTDGLILVDIAIEDHQVASLERRGIEITTVGSAAVGRPVVGIDDEHVGALAAEYLIGLGHTRIGILEGFLGDPLNFTVPRARRRGFRDALARHGVELRSDLIADGGFDVDGGQRATAVVLDRPDPPTAIFSMSDEMAFGALLELRLRGLEVGRDVSVLGVDDHEFARIVDLSTIHQPVARHGQLAAALLVDALEHAGESRADGRAFDDDVERDEVGRHVESVVERHGGAIHRTMVGGHGGPVHRSDVVLLERTTTGPPPGP
ncbi:MAG: LacI family DNA-binding transcriptional regulator [Actinomycetota bacterium]